MRRLVFILTPEETFTPTHSGAIATHTRACCRAAQQAGHDPLVIARPSPHASAYDDVASVTFAYPPVPERGAALLWRRAERKWRRRSRLCYAAYIREMVATLRRHDLQDQALVVHNDPELVVALRQFFPGARIIHWFHNQHPCKVRPRRRFRGSVDATIAVSDFLKQWVRDYYGPAESELVRVYNGVDAQTFRPAEGSAAESNGHRPIINFTGRTGVEKAPDLVLKAALSLARGGAQPFAVQIIGANHWGARTMDDYQRQLDALAEALRAEGVEVTLTGHLSRAETAERMQRADIHVVSSRWAEPFGLTTLEGMASRLATVGSATGATPEVIGEHGLLFDSDNVEALADRLESLIAKPQQRETLARAGRVRAEQFTWDRTWAGLEAVLERVG